MGTFIYRAILIMLCIILSIVLIATPVIFSMYLRMTKAEIRIEKKEKQLDKKLELLERKLNQWNMHWFLFCYLLAVKTDTDTIVKTLNIGKTRTVNIPIVKRLKIVLIT